MTGRTGVSSVACSAKHAFQIYVKQRVRNYDNAMLRSRHTCMNPGVRTRNGPETREADEHTAQNQTVEEKDKDW